MEPIVLRFIQTMSATLIGEAVAGEYFHLTNPRTCQLDHNEGVVNLVPLLGNPEAMIVNEAMVIHTYLNNDPMLDDFYDREVRNPVEPEAEEKEPGLKAVPDKE